MIIKRNCIVFKKIITDNKARKMEYFQDKMVDVRFKGHVKGEETATRLRLKIARSQERQVRTRKDFKQFPLFK